MTKGTKRTLLIVGLAGAAYLVWKMLQARPNPYENPAYFSPQPGGAGYDTALLTGDSALLTAATAL